MVLVDHCDSTYKYVQNCLNSEFPQRRVGKHDDICNIQYQRSSIGEKNDDIFCQVYIAYQHSKGSHQPLNLMNFQFMHDKFSEIFLSHMDPLFGGDAVLQCISLWNLVLVSQK